MWRRWRFVWNSFLYECELLVPYDQFYDTPESPCTLVMHRYEQVRIAVELFEPLVTQIPHKLYGSTLRCQSNSAETRPRRHGMPNAQSLVYRSWKSGSNVKPKAVNGTSKLPWLMPCKGRVALAFLPSFFWPRIPLGMECHDWLIQTVNTSFTADL